MNARQTLLGLYAAGLAAVNGAQAVYRYLQARNLRQPCHVVAIGKAADAMLEGARRYLHADLRSALLITKHAHVSEATRKLATVEVWETAHPVPDESSLRAGQRLLAYVQQLPADEPLLFLLSGGASSLVEVLADDWTLEGLQAATQAMLADGSSITQINTLRRSLSRIKGGRLWQYLDARPISCLLISDVEGDDPNVIGSGLLFPPPECAFTWQMVASNAQLLRAIADQPCALPITLMPEFLSGDAVETATNCVAYLRQATAGVYVWGAETTVQLPLNPQRGGRNQHLALAAALQLQPEDTITLLVAGTDGTDGASDDAGAIVDATTLTRGKYANLDPVTCLQNADAGTFLDASGDLIHTGATGTNVMDVVIGLKL